MNFMHYIIISTICLSILYAAYRLLFKEDINFTQLRIILLGIIVFSLLIPFNRLSIELYPAETLALQEPGKKEITQDSQFINTDVLYDMKNISNTDTFIRFLAIDWIRLLKGLYVLIAFVFILRIIFQLSLLVYYYFHSEKVKKENYCILYNTKFRQSFTFFKWIFIPKGRYSSEEKDKILAHEKIHAIHYHSIDLLLIELLTAVMWFNPLVWMMKNSMQLVHEYIADKGALGTGIEKHRYQALLINQVAEERFVGLSSSFNPVCRQGRHSLIKKRMIMMTKSKFNPKAKLRIFALLPVATVIFFGVSCINGQNKEEVVTAIEPVGMNVLYLGVENPIKIAASGYEAAELEVTIDNGTIEGGKGEYIILPEKPGTAVVVVSKDSKEIQRSEFRVKVLPDPVARITDIKGWKIDRNTLLELDEIRAEINADFNIYFEIVEFVVIARIEGEDKVVKSNSSKITPEQRELFKHVKDGEMIVITGIKCKGPDGSIRDLGSLTYQIIDKE